MDTWLFILATVVHYLVICLVSIRSAANGWLMHEGTSTAASRNVWELLVKSATISIGLNHDRVIAFTLLSTNICTRALHKAGALFNLSIRMVPSTNSKHILTCSGPRVGD